MYGYHRHLCAYWNQDGSAIFAKHKAYLIEKIYSSNVICQPEELGIGTVHTQL